jgi:two-component system sensor histidine kinase KdpD
MRQSSTLFGDARPSPVLGAIAGLGGVALTTAIVYALKQAVPVVALGVVYMVAVLVVSAVWGAWFGAATALLSALAFNFFHIPPTGRLTIAESENWAALATFLLCALVASSVAEQARDHAREADERRREADLAAELARLLLRGDRLHDGLAAASHRLAQALGLPSAAIELTAIEGDDRRIAFPLRDGARQIGTLVLPADTPEGALRRVQERVVGALETLLAPALEREALMTDVVETEALRRSDVVKTALLRAVSHDLRSPLTAVVTAGEALNSTRLSEEDRHELAAVVTEESGRLSRLIDNLLDLSRLEAEAAQPRLETVSVEEVIDAAIDDLGLPQGAFTFALAADLPPVRADAGQLERALSNVLENSSRYSGGHPVSVRARRVGNRLVIRIVDRGPGIPAAQRERVFQPFYRAGTEQSGHRGSGLGLAIARGFIEANEGSVVAESLPGQGTSFVIELPLDQRVVARVDLRPEPEAAP